MIDAMKQALETLQGSGYYDTTQQREAITALRQAIAEAESQPHTDHPVRHWDRTCPACVAEAEKQQPVGCDCNQGQVCHICDPILPAEPKREWVSLTMEDIDNVTGDIGFGYIDVSFAIEARLKELNNG
jgi:hypothetical protein